MSVFNKNITLLHPIFKLTVGSLEIEGGSLDCNVIALRSTPAPSAFLAIPNVDGEMSGKIKIGDPLSVEWGYADAPAPLPKLTTIFNGHVYELTERERIRISAYDRLVKYNWTKFNQEHRKETPAAVIGGLCKRVGLDAGQLPDLPKMDRVVLIDASLSDAIKNITIWFRKNGEPLDGYAHFIDSDGKLQWGDENSAVNPQPEIDIEIDESLILSGGIPALRQAQGDKQLGSIKTVSLPWLRHSTTATVTDNRFAKQSGVRFIQSVIYEQRGHSLSQEIGFYG